MTDAMPTYRYTEFIEAPAHSVFEYWRDPRRIYADDPMLKVVEAILSPEGVGTAARLAAKMLFLTEDIMIEYVEFVADRRIVFQAHPKMFIAHRVLKRGVSVAVHNWAWTFEPEDRGTRLNLVVVELEPPWWQRVLDRAFEKGFNTQVRNRLARIKARTEEEAVGSFN